VVRVELHVERGPGRPRLGQDPRSDERESGKWLSQHVGERDVDRQNAALLGKLVHPLLALEVVVAVPTTYELVIAGEVLPRAIGEETARLARPCQQGEIVLGEPRPRRGIRSG